MSSGFDKKYGFVAIMDAIGISSLDHSQCEEFREKIENLDVGIGKQKNERDVPKLEMIFHEKQPVLNHYVINDTIIVTLSLNENDNLSDSTLFTLLKRFNIILKNLFITCLKWGIAMRGSFSIGRIIESDKIPLVLGEATNDAAKFYESFEFLGIIATQKCTIKIKSIIEAFSRLNDTEVDINKHLSEFDYSLIEREVPFKCGHIEKVLLLGWPLYYLSGQSWEKNMGLKGLESDLRRCSPSIQGIKRENTHCCPK